MVNQQRSTLIIIVHYSFLFSAWNMVQEKLKCLLPSQLCMRFVWLLWNIIWTTSIKWNLQRGERFDHILYALRSLAWESLMWISAWKTGPIGLGWPSNLHSLIMCSMSGVWKNGLPWLIIFFYHYCMRHISWQKSVKQFAALKYGFRYHTTTQLLVALKILWRTKTRWEEKPKQLLC